MSLRSICLGSLLTAPDCMIFTMFRYRWDLEFSSAHRTVQLDSQMALSSGTTNATLVLLRLGLRRGVLLPPHAQHHPVSALSSFSLQSFSCRTASTSASAPPPGSGTNKGFPCDTHAPMQHLSKTHAAHGIMSQLWEHLFVGTTIAAACILHPHPHPLPLPPPTPAGAPSSSSSGPPAPRPTPSAAATGSAVPPPTPLPPPPRITPVASASAGAWAGTGAGAPGQPPLGYNKPAEHPGERERGGRLGEPHREG